MNKRQTQFARLEDALREARRLLLELPPSRLVALGAAPAYLGAEQNYREHDVLVCARHLVAFLESSDAI